MCAMPILLLLLFLLLGTTSCAGSRAEMPGVQADGSTLLPNGWSLRPHGQQIPLASDLPVRAVVHPAGRFIAVQHAGYRRHEVAVYDSQTRKVVARRGIPKTWSWMCFGPDGKKLYVSGGVDDVVHELDFDAQTGALRRGASRKLSGFAGGLKLPAGLATDATGQLFVPLQRADLVLLFSREGRLETMYDLEKGSFPFECVVHDGRLFVSAWGKARVEVFDVASRERIATIPAGEHPSELLLDAARGRLFVSNANENTVHVIDLETLRVRESLCSSLYGDAPPGSTPNSLALSPNGDVLLIANADNNNLAVVDVSKEGQSRGLGFIPVGLYPTAVRWLPNGEVFVLNGKGSAGSHANPGGPTPLRRAKTLAEYSGSMFRGSISHFRFPQPREL